MSSKQNPIFQIACFAPEYWVGDSVGLARLKKHFHELLTQAGILPEVCHVRIQLDYAAVQGMSIMMIVGECSGEYLEKANIFLETILRDTSFPLDCISTALLLNVQQKAGH